MGLACFLLCAWAGIFFGHELLEKAKNVDTLFIFSYNAWKHPSTISMTETLLDLNIPSALFVLRDPLDASLFPAADLVIKTFSPSTPSLQAICDEIAQRK